MSLAVPTEEVTFVPTPVHSLITCQELVQGSTIMHSSMNYKNK